MQHIWEIIVSGFVPAIFWCVVHPVITVATCTGATVIAIRHA